MERVAVQLSTHSKSSSSLSTPSLNWLVLIGDLELLTVSDGLVTDDRPLSSELLDTKFCCCFTALWSHSVAALRSTLSCLSGPAGWFLPDWLLTAAKLTLPTSKLSQSIAVWRCNVSPPGPDSLFTSPFYNYVSIIISTHSTCQNRLFLYYY